MPVIQEHKSILLTWFTVLPFISRFTNASVAIVQIHAWHSVLARATGAFVFTLKFTIKIFAMLQQLCKRCYIYCIYQFDEMVLPNGPTFNILDFCIFSSAAKRWMSGYQSGVYCVSARKWRRKSIVYVWHECKILVKPRMWKHHINTD